MTTNLIDQVRGDLNTLDLVGVFEALGYPVTEAAPGKYWVTCLWSHEHSSTGRSDTVVWQPGNSWPEFHCSHDHCVQRKLNAVLTLAESLHPGIIDAFCSATWTPDGSVNKADYQQRELKAKPAADLRRFSKEEAIRNTKRVLGDLLIDESDLWHASTIYPGKDWRHDSILLFENLYQPEEFVCICTDYGITIKKDGGKKAVPKGSGVTKSAAQWIEVVKDSGTPESAAGTWIRLNPVVETGNSNSGAHVDSDVTQHRYILLESDALPIELQLSLFAWLALPVAAIVSSGGKSVHAWVKLDSAGAHEFRAEADHILTRLAQFGVDQANKNPSRYGRLSGAFRSIGNQAALRHDDAGQQRLLYLNPMPVERPIFS
jgi:hypothetical protein